MDKKSRTKIKENKLIQGEHENSKEIAKDDIFNSEKEKKLYTNFKRSNLVEIIGTQISQKQKLLSHLLTNILYANFFELSKIPNQTPPIKVLYIDSEGNFSPSYFNKIFKRKLKEKLVLNQITKETAAELNKIYENSIYIYKIFSYKDTIQLLETELSKILEDKELNFKIIVFDNLNSFLNSKSSHYGNYSMKTNKKHIQELYSLAKKRKITVKIIFFMNNLKLVKAGEEFFLEPENGDYLNEFMNVIMLVENNDKNCDEYRIKIIKSSSDHNEYWVEMKNNALIFE